MIIRAPRGMSVLPVFFATLQISFGTAAPLSSMEAQGKELYMFGTQQEDPQPKVLLGAQAAPARLAPCASCHGEDGAGRPEGRIIPPDINWSELSKPKTHANGRARPPFSEDSVVQAVTVGIDPAGNRLDAVMPRYEFSRAQFEALVAWLKAMEADQAPGVSANAIHIAAIVPSGSVVGATLLATFDEIAGGGVFNRKIEVSLIEDDGRSEDAAARLEALLKDRAIFAVLALSGGGESITRAAWRARAPLIGGEASSESDRQTAFHLLPGAAAQMRILVAYVAKSRKGSAQAAVIYPSDSDFDDAGKAVAEQSARKDFPAPIEQRYSASSFDAASIARALKAQGCDTVYFLGNRKALALLIAAAQASNFYPTLLFPGALISPDIFEARQNFAGKLFFTASISPDEVLRDPGFLALRGKYHLGSRSLASQGLTYAAAQVFTQGLKIAGRRLSRARFTAAIESLRDFDAGVIPPVTFGPRERVGVPGAYVLELNLAQRGVTRVSGFMVAN